VIDNYLNFKIAGLKLCEILGLQGSRGEAPKDQHRHENNLIREDVSFTDFRQKNTIKYGIFEDAFGHKALISTYEPYKDLYEAFIDPGLEPYGAWPGPATESTAYAHELPSRFSQYSLQLPDELQNRIQDVQDQSTK